MLQFYDKVIEKILFNEADRRAKLIIQELNTLSKNYDLSAKNPNGKGEVEHKSPIQILKSIQSKENEIQKIIYGLEASLINASIPISNLIPGTANKDMSIFRSTTSSIGIGNEKEG